MKRKMHCLICLLLFSTLMPAASAQDEEWGAAILPLAQVKPGMKGIGKTVFYGEQIEDFGVEVIDIIQNLYPRHDAILVRLTGLKAEQAGVVSGMSGSPIYIDNKLVGALSLRFGQFMKEPIAGVTPIEAMLEIEQKESMRELEMSGRVSLFHDYLKVALCGAEKNFWQDLVALSSSQGADESGAMTPIYSPLIMAGFDNQLISQYKDVFLKLGFVALPGGSASSGQQSLSRPFEPGAAISQVFISGDFGIESTGTVTAVNQNKILAFGHSLFNVGPVHLPLAHAKVLTTLASSMASTKMAMATDIAGSIRQDRMTGVLGDISVPPKMIPVTIHMTSPGQEAVEYHLQMANDPSLNNILPFYLRVALTQALTSGRLATDHASFDMDGCIQFNDGRRISIQDFFSASRTFGVFEPGIESANVCDLMASAVGVLMVTKFPAPEIQKIDLTTRVIPGEKVAAIYSLRQDKTELSPGDSITLNIVLKNSKGENERFTRILQIPKKCKSDRLLVFVSSAVPLTQYEVQRNREKFIPNNFEQLLSILNKRRKNNQLYIQIRSLNSGMIMDGKELSSLPPSIMHIMDSRHVNGESARLQERVIVDLVIPTEYHVTGAKKLTIMVKQPQNNQFPDMDDVMGFTY